MTMADIPKELTKEEVFEGAARAAAQGGRDKGWHAEQAAKAVEAAARAEAAAAETAEDADAADASHGKRKAKKKRTRKPFTKAKAAVLAVIVVVIIAAAAGMYSWHESPDFCSTMCHIENTYVNNHAQPQNSIGTDKYGNVVSNSNAMMAVLHSHTKATAKPEIVCVDCHIPNMMELAHDGVSFATGGYSIPRDERQASQLESWDGKEGSQFCANENCHVYLLGDDGKVSMDKLADVTSGLAFNPHEQHHENLTLECTSCHKGHRASTVVCTACHKHQDIDLPEGWVDWNTSQQIMVEAFAG